MYSHLFGRNEEGVTEWAVIEVQGELGSKEEGSLDGQLVGDLYYNREVINQFVLISTRVNFIDLISLTIYCINVYLCSISNVVSLFFINSCILLGGSDSNNRSSHPFWQSAEVGQTIRCFRKSP